MKIRIATSEIKNIKVHGTQTYPDECCGVLIGDVVNGIPVVTETKKMRNTNAGNPTRRYNIDPMDLLKLEDELDDKGMRMLGIYHSHPDHPSRPSEFDRSHAWPNLSYMVLSVNHGEADLLTSWRLNRDNNEFIEEEIETLEE